jgi:hypothetical protein
MLRRDQRLPLGLAALAAVAVLVALVQSTTGAGGDLLLGAPVLVLLLALLTGRYLGEERIARLASRLMAPRRRRAHVPTAPLRRAAKHTPRGGRLLAAALAERGPPAVVAAG